MDKITDYKKILVTGVPMLVTLPVDAAMCYSVQICNMGEKHFEINCPVEGELPAPVCNNMDLQMTTPADKGYYFFTSKVMARIGVKSPLLRMSFPQYIEKCERREFFRLEMMKKIKLYATVLSAKGSEVATFSKDTLGEYTCIDISGGGARIICDIEFPEGTFLGLDFSGMISGFQIVKCIVVRSYVRPDGMIDMRLKFVNLKNQERTNIIKYCYAKQIERRQMAPQTGANATSFFC